MSYDAGMEVDTGGERMVPVGEWANYTYNVAPMFRLAFGTEDGVRTLHGKAGAEAVPLIADALAYFTAHREELRALNPENGWGNVGGARRFLVRLLEEAQQHPKAMVGVR